MAAAVVFAAGRPAATRPHRCCVFTVSADWHVFSDSATGHAITSWKCTRTRRISVPSGTATIFGGYARNFKRCPQGPPQAFPAWVKVGGATVVVDPPFAADSIELFNLYGSFAGIEAIVRALRLRPPPRY